MNDHKADPTLVDCARCGRLIPIADSAEYSLVRGGVMVEFYHCADRAYCNRVANQAIDEKR